jgi:alanyl-tRNA synthetase
MTSSQIRQSFLDFFKSKGHTLVPSSSLLPDSPNLLFTNAGMNQFVPIFLGEHKTDVSRWPGAIPGKDTRAADTQKCIRAGGKHNDLDDVGLDTYHHTFFEMLGNWSFGDYFKKEAIEWAWELVVDVWQFPPDRLYATVFCPYLGEPGWERKWRVELEQVLALAMTSPVFIPPPHDASPFDIADQEAAMYWAKRFAAFGLDPKIHIIPGSRQDNFWMMGDTGPCGPCSEIHVDLTAAGDTNGSLVNRGDPRCIEIWNLVFIQFNANADETFTQLPEQHVDTGMGFERVTSIIQSTGEFKDFAHAKISNYETDIFRPVFDALEELSGKRYGSTLPTGKRVVEDVDGQKEVPAAATEEEVTDIAFRVIGDHIRTVSFAIADGVEPGNGKREYVVRRILRRAARFGRALGFREPFFYKLVDVLADTMGDVFPEIREQKEHIQEVICTEEEAFNRTLDRGIELFEDAIEKLQASISADQANSSPSYAGSAVSSGKDPMTLIHWKQEGEHLTGVVTGDFAFQLYDTYGFPLDLTELMAREYGMTVDKEGFAARMEEQKRRGQEAHEQRKVVIEVSQIENTAATNFVGFDTLEADSQVVEIVNVKGKTAVVLDTTPFYAAMGGQVGDTGILGLGNRMCEVDATSKTGGTFLHFLKPGAAAPSPGDGVLAHVDSTRRNAIQRHHTVTHLLHWALHEVVSRDASQQGSYVGPEKLTFDFNSQSLTSHQIADVERLVNERILDNAPVSWLEVPYDEVKSRGDIMQFFEDKYGDLVRVVQIGGEFGQLNGYSMELCGGTHARATGEIGLFRIVSESAIAAGVRRIEAVAGLEAYRRANDELHLIRTLAGKINSPVHELEKKIESLLAHQKELEKEVKITMLRNASNAASELLGHARDVNGIPLITHNLGEADGDFLQAIVDSLKGRFQGVVVLGGASRGAVALAASVSPDFAHNIHAGRLVQRVAALVGGKGGGKPDIARGGGRDVGKLDAALAKVPELMGA